MTKAIELHMLTWERDNANKNYHEAIARVRKFVGGPDVDAARTSDVRNAIAAMVEAAEHAARRDALNEGLTFLVSAAQNAQ